MLFLGIDKSWCPSRVILGPLLFWVYINDITFAAESSEVRLFADDTVLYLFIDNPVQNAEALNRDLENLSNWALEWLVKFSPSKTKTMIISRKRKLGNFPPLTMNGKNLEEVQSFKHLGVTITNNLNWDEHIENLTVKANQCLDVLNALKYRLDWNTIRKTIFCIYAV